MRALLFATLLASLPLHAQDWPAKAVHIIVPFPAGGSADLLPRVVAEKLTEKWGQPVIVDNRPGAAGNIGADTVFRAEPDGYTLLSSPPPPSQSRPRRLQIAHIPYKGTAPALTDLLAGQVDMMCDNLGVSLPHVRSGKLRALAVASKQRFAGLPNVPALAETLPGFESVAWFGIVAPPRPSTAIAEKVAAAV